MANVAPARADDLPAILELLERSDLPRAGLADHLATTLVAHDGGAVVGSAAVERYGDAGLLRSVAVDRAYRGQGLGTALVGAALELARRQGVRTLYLLTTTAGDYFPRFGFRPVTRDDVAPAVRQSAEFTGACPASALVMRADLD
ncbi:MAG TPA: arsenic resistance N-acetyltransferase ArsN2 [Roseiflexaceae bacterium]|nr:arsenic resistance N-acetyltransferase ArsN2 [Roseiflexaceae bacterium]